MHRPSQTGMSALFEQRRCLRHNPRVSIARGRRVRASRAACSAISSGRPSELRPVRVPALYKSSCCASRQPRGHDSPGEGWRGWLRRRRAAREPRAWRELAFWLIWDQPIALVHGTGLASPVSSCHTISFFFFLKTASAGSTRPSLAAPPGPVGASSSVGRVGGGGAALSLPGGRGAARTADHSPPFSCRGSPRRAATARSPPWARAWRSRVQAVRRRRCWRLCFARRAMARTLPAAPRALERPSLPPTARASAPSRRRSMCRRRARPCSSTSQARGVASARHRNGGTVSCACEPALDRTAVARAASRSARCASLNLRAPWLQTGRRAPAVRLQGTSRPNALLPQSSCSSAASSASSFGLRVSPP